MRSPLIRMRIGTPTERCRSEAPASIIRSKYSSIFATRSNPPYVAERIIVREGPPGNRKRARRCFAPARGMLAAMVRAALRVAFIGLALLAGGARADEPRVAPHGDPLPTRAVDPARFPPAP